MQLIPVSSIGGEETRTVVADALRQGQRQGQWNRAENALATQVFQTNSKHILETRRAGWPPPHQPARKRQCVVSSLVSRRAKASTLEMSSLEINDFHSGNWTMSSNPKSYQEQWSVGLKSKNCSRAIYLPRRPSAHITFIDKTDT